MIMRILLILAVPMLSVVFSLMSSGIENVLTADNPDWRTIPIFYWLAFWALLWYSVYHFRFGSTKKLKIFFLKTIIRARLKYLATQVINKPDDLNRIQKKAVAVWTQMVRDREVEMHSCMVTNRRMLRKDGTTCIITPTSDVNFIFARVGTKDVYFDVFLPNTVISSLYNSFDREQKERFDRIVEDCRSAVSATVVTV
jgi:hypothetical protein